MKKRFLMLMSLVLLCATVLSLGACTDPDQPGTDEPDTAQPQTPVDTSGEDLKTSEPQTGDIESPAAGEIT